MNYFLILALLVLSGCGQDDSIPSGSGTQDSELQPYLESFLVEAEQRGVMDIRELSTHLTIEFAKLDFANQPLSQPEVAGQCVHSNGVFMVQVDSDNWNSLLMQGSETNRTALMYHEFGHCLLGRGHTSAMWIDPELQNKSEPASLMYPNSSNAELGFYYDHSRYMDEMFQNRGH